MCVCVFVCVCVFFFFFFFNSFYYRRPSFSLPPSRNSDPGSHSRLFSPIPTTVRALHFYPEEISALPLVDSRRMRFYNIIGDVPTIGRRIGRFSDLGRICVIDSHFWLLSRSFKADRFPILLWRGYTVAHVVGYDPHNLHDLAHFFWVGSVLCRSCAISQLQIRI